MSLCQIRVRASLWGQSVLKLAYTACVIFAAVLAGPVLATEAPKPVYSDVGSLPVIPDNIRRNPDDPLITRHSITLARDIVNETKYLGESVTIYCDIVGKPMPTYVWFKDAVPIGDGGHDVRLKPEVTLYGALLQIRQLKVSDSGWYRCVGSNLGGSAETTGKLTVLPTQRPIKKDKRPPSSSSSSATSDGDSGGAPETGFCQNFKPNVCSSFLSGRDVFVLSNVFQYNKEAELLQLLQRMADLVNDTECTQPLMETLCRYNFPECLRSGLSGPRPRRLCRRDCQLVTQHRCRENFEKLRASLGYFQENAHSDVDYISLLPNCGSLPVENSNQQCVSLITTQQSTVKPPVPPRPPPPPPLLPTLRPAVLDCYNASDATSYRGSASHSRSGRVCLPWTLIPGYSTVGSHNRCRSPPVAGPHPPPWCFVSGAGEWEDCDVPQCPKPPPPPPPPVWYTPRPPQRDREGPAILDGSNRNQLGDKGDSGGIVISIKELLPISISLAVLVIIAIVLTVVCCVYRRSAKAAAAADAAAAAASDGLGGKAMRLAVTKKSESDVRLDLQCSTPLLNAQEFPITQIRFGEQLGESAFGRVYKGELIGVYSETSLTPVAIKCLNAGADAALQEEFSQELQRLAGLSHPNLLRLLGVSLRQSPRCLAMELPPHGDLHEYLAYRSPRCDHSGDYHDPLSQAQMFHMAIQVASAVEYLALRCLVHRDIAARNIQLGEKLDCKLSDLGQCRDVYAPDYYLLRPGSRLPIRWMPPEATLYGQFTTYSDAYSFGVLLWEIWSYGLQPYYGYTNSEVIELVRQRQLLACPQDCPSKLYSLMLECWSQPIVHRVTATELRNRLRQLQSELLVELSNSSQGSSAGHTNSTAFSGERLTAATTQLMPQLASQRIIPVPVPQMSPPGSSAGSAGSTTAYSTGGGSSLVQSYQLHGPPRQQQQLGLRHNFQSTMAV